MINVRLSGIPRTFVLTLRARAEEQDRNDALFDDPWSADWFSYMPKFDDYERWYNESFQLATAIRTRLIDDIVSDFIAAHDNPLVVELGAGLSTRYYRLDKGKTTWIEQDLDDVVQVRRKLDVDKNEHWFLAGDIADTERWMSQLPDHDPAQTIFIAEGVLMFLNPKSVETMFAALAAHYSGATMAFDVVNDGYMEHANDSFEKLNAPMKWSSDEKDLEDLGVDVLNTRYILMEHSDRWDEIGVGRDRLTKNRSGYIVEAQIR